MMLSIRQTAVAVGVLFLAATITFFSADSLITRVLGDPDAWVDVSAYGNVLKVAALLAFTTSSMHPLRNIWARCSRPNMRSPSCWSFCLPA